MSSTQGNSYSRKCSGSIWVNQSDRCGGALADAKAQPPRPAPPPAMPPLGRLQVEQALTCQPRCPAAGFPPSPPPRPQVPLDSPQLWACTIPAHRRGTAPARWRGLPWTPLGTPAVSASRRRSISRERWLRVEGRPAPEDRGLWPGPRLRTGPKRASKVRSEGR